MGNLPCYYSNRIFLPTPWRSKHPDRNARSAGCSESWRENPTRKLINKKEARKKSHHNCFPCEGACLLWSPQPNIPLHDMVGRLSTCQRRTGPSYQVSLGSRSKATLRTSSLPAMDVGGQLAFLSFAFPSGFHRLHLRIR